jgi:hypothetical protein
MLLNERDTTGRLPGARVGTLDAALESLNELDRHNKWK